MKKHTFLFFFCISSIFCFAQSNSPDVLFGELFKEVQLKGIFADSKTFADAIPLFSATEIMKKYEAEKKKLNVNSEKKKNGFDLEKFVRQNFKIPEIKESNFKSDPNLPVEQHIANLWKVLTRKPEINKDGSLLSLSKNYVVPGGRFGEIYYWDSYFTMLGLEVSGEKELIKSMIDNFADMINQYDHIPNGNRTYFLSRSQPPFFALMLDFLTEKEQLEKLPILQKEYDYWMAINNRPKEDFDAYKHIVGNLPFTLLNRYYDEDETPRPESYKEDVHLAEKNPNPKALYRHLRAACESGWDFSSRWFADGKNLETIHTTEILPVDLNCLMFYMESKLSKLYALKNDSDNKSKYSALANDRRISIENYFWDSEKKFYMDYDFVEGKRTEIYSLAAVFPLFFKISNPEQAAQVAEKLKKDFLKTGGLLTTLSETPQQWDSPNGWAPLQYMAIKGLENYGQTELANEIRKRWIDLNVKIYTKTGKLVEKYNVTDKESTAGGGEYPLQDGFGWTNGVLLKLISEKK